MGPPIPEDREEYAMYISHVSRLWRDVALGTHSLWNSIRVDCLYNGEGQLRMLDLFIARSHEHPLDITIDLVRDEDGYYWGLSAQTDKIFPLLSRWRSLRVSGNIREDVFDALYPLRHVYAPVLQAFEVKIEPSASEDPDDFDGSLLLFQGGAPKLTQIEMHEISVVACQPPLSSVVSLRLYHPPSPYRIDQYRNILTASSNLTNLRLVGDIADTGQLYMAATSRMTIRVPSLRSLTISPSWSMDSCTIYSLLASLETPLLQCLTMHCCPRKNHVSEFQEVFRNYGPPRYPLLRSLTLRSADFAQPDALWFTLALPSITHLSLIGCNSPARLLRQLLPYDLELPTHKDKNYFIRDRNLSVKDESRLIDLPLLRVICLSPIDLADFVVLCDIISNRVARGTPIATVQFASKDLNAIPEDKLEWMRERVRVKVSELN